MLSWPRFLQPCPTPLGSGWEFLPAQLRDEDEIPRGVHGHSTASVGFLQSASLPYRPYRLPYLRQDIGPARAAAPGNASGMVRTDLHRRPCHLRPPPPAPRPPPPPRGSRLHQAQGRLRLGRSRAPTFDDCLLQEHTAPVVQASVKRRLRSFVVEFEDRNVGCQLVHLSSTPQFRVGSQNFSATCSITTGNPIRRGTQQEHMKQLLGRLPRSKSAESGGTRCTEGLEPCGLRLRGTMSGGSIIKAAPTLRVVAFSSLGLLLELQFGQGRHGSHEIQILTHRVTVEDHVIGERSGAFSLVNDLVRLCGTKAGPFRGGHETLKVQDSGHRDFVVRAICCCPWPVLGRWCAELPHVEGGLRCRGPAADPRKLLALRVTGSKPRAESLQCWAGCVRRWLTGVGGESWR